MMTILLAMPWAMQKVEGAPTHRECEHRTPMSTTNNHQQQ
jgi:hypothetical protein